MSLIPARGASEPAGVLVEVAVGVSEVSFAGIGSPEDWCPFLVISPASSRPSSHSLFMYRLKAALYSFPDCRSRETLSDRIFRVVVPEEALPSLAPVRGPHYRQGGQGTLGPLLLLLPRTWSMSDTGCPTSTLSRNVVGRLPGRWPPLVGLGGGRLSFQP